MAASPGFKSDVRVDEYNDFASLLRRYRVALARLEALAEIQIRASSRLRAYERRLQQVINDLRPALEWDLVMQMAFDLREIDEIIEIADYLPPALNKGVRSLLRRTVGGTDHPDAEVSAPAREAQYELYLGAVIRRAGYDAEHGKPDLVIHGPGGEHFLEAKRPSSQSRFDDRLRSAVHQIRRLPKSGLIAISLDQVVRPPTSILGSRDFDAIAPGVASLVSEFVGGQTKVWQNRLALEPVAALILTARVPARLESTGHIVLGTNIHLEVIEPSDSDDSESAVAKAIVTAYLQAQNSGILLTPVAGDREPR
jgi:hypothetical protein